MAHAKLPAGLGAVLAVCAALAWLPVHAAPATMPASRPATGPASGASGAVPAAVIGFSGRIDDYSRDAFKKRVEQARAAGAKVIIIDLDSPGGLVDTSQDLSRFIRGLGDTRTVAYVHPNALSGAAMMAVACDEIWMAPHALLGDCAPIVMTDRGLQSLGKDEREKAESPIRETFKASAERNGLDSLLVQAMVSMRIVVHWVENERGDRRFVDPAEYQRLVATGRWKPVAGEPDPIDSADSLLTVHSKQAVKYGLAKGIASSVEDLAAKLNLNVIQSLEPKLADKVIQLLSSAYIRGVLLVLFLLALYVAFHVPGHGLPEAVAMILLGVLVGVPLLTGYAQWWELAAIFVGLTLLALELFVIPGFGVVGVLGIILVLGGMILTFVGREPSNLPGVLPQLPATWIALQRGLVVVVVGLIVSILLMIWLRRFLPRMPYLNRLILTTVVGQSDSQAAGVPAAATIEEWPPEGTIGKAVTELKPGGSAEFADALSGETRVIGVISDSGFVEVGGSVVVRRVNGNEVIVRPVGGGAQEA